MFNHLLFINHIYFLLIRNILLDMTINNPIFIFALITFIWFIPGILVSRFKELHQKKTKNKIQTDAINRLYPKNKDFKDFKD